MMTTIATKKCFLNRTLIYLKRKRCCSNCANDQEEPTQRIWRMNVKEREREKARIHKNAKQTAGWPALTDRRTIDQSCTYEFKKKIHTHSITHSLLIKRKIG